MELSDNQKAIITEYGSLFNNTGGNNIIELIERKGINYFNNCIVAELQGCCYSQTLLLERLRKEGFLL